VVVGELDPIALAGTAVHEAFHVFQRANARPDRRFGRGENSALVSRYPVFDARDEAAFALEARLLSEALRATRRTDRVRLAQEFVAAREARHRRLPEEIAQFDRMAELNEGLAEYALLRTSELLARRDGGRVSRRTLTLADSLRTITGDVSRSVRLRFYSTGPAMAVLLDRMVGPSWKRRLVEDDLTLQEAVAEAAGLRERERSLIADATRRHPAPDLLAEAERNIAALRARRRAQMDSVLAAPGVLLVVDASRMAQRDHGNCGFDPQNTLPVTQRIKIHMRWFRPCNTSNTSGEFNTKVVHDESLGTLAAVLGDESAVEVTIGGGAVRLADGERREGQRDIRIVAPSASYQAGKGTLVRRGRELRLELEPD
jgi:hypothetical protein